jgi:four helix bundle protein
MNNYIAITDRTKQFALRIIKAYGWLKKQNEECRIIGHQLFRSATSIGAMVREAQSAQSNKDFINKLEIGLKECRESQYWIELLIESNLVSKERFQPLLNEANEIGKILVSSTKKLKEK